MGRGDGAVDNGVLQDNSEIGELVGRGGLDNDTDRVESPAAS